MSEGMYKSTLLPFRVPAVFMSEMQPAPHHNLICALSGARTERPRSRVLGMQQRRARSWCSGATVTTKTSIDVRSTLSPNAITGAPACRRSLFLGCQSSLVVTGRRSSPSGEDRVSNDSLESTAHRATGFHASPIALRKYAIYFKMLGRSLRGFGESVCLRAVVGARG